MPTMEEIFREHEQQNLSEADEVDRAFLAKHGMTRDSLKARALEYIAANLGKHTPELPKELMQGFRDAAHAREITHSAKGGWVLAPEHIDEPETEEVEEEETDDDADEPEEK